MIVILGGPFHPGLALLYELLQSRGRAKALFVAMESFPSRVGLYLGATPEESSLVFPEGTHFQLSEVQAVVMDGFYVSEESLLGLDPGDIPYVQTETWAALIAMFELIGRRGLLANYVTEREVLGSRWGILRYLASQGLPVPRSLVTSDRDALQRFLDEVGSVGYKPVADVAELLNEVKPDEKDRFERLHLCPVHFEEAPQGRSGNLAIVGERVFAYPPDAEPPPEEFQRRCQQAAANLGLVLAEVPVRCVEDRWMATGLRSFLSPGSLQESPIAEAAAELLEQPR